MLSSDLLQTSEYVRYQPGKITAKHKLTQEEFAKQSRKGWYWKKKSCTHRSYECGRRFPSIVTLCACAEYFGVSLNGFAGTSEDASIKTSTSKKKKSGISDIKAIDYDLVIRPQELKNYNQQAAHVEGNGNSNFVGRWGLVDYSDEHQWIVFTNGYIELPANVTIYRAKPVAAERLSDMNMFPLSYAALTKEKFWAYGNSLSDAIARERYSGYYRLNDEKDGLINVEKTVISSLIGLGKSLSLIPLIRTFRIK